MSTIHCDPDQKACDFETKLHVLSTQFETTRNTLLFLKPVLSRSLGKDLVVLLLLDFLNFFEGTTLPPPPLFLCLLPPLWTSSTARNKWWTKGNKEGRFSTTRSLFQTPTTISFSCISSGIQRSWLGEIKSTPAEDWRTGPRARLNSLILTGEIKSTPAWGCLTWPARLHGLAGR